MRKYKVLIIGHAQYPSGSKDFLDFFGIPVQEILILNISDKHTSDEFKSKFKKMIEQYDDLLIIADLTGGSPHQMAVQILQQAQEKNQYLISGIAMSVLMEICLKATVIGMENVNKEIMEAIDMGNKNVMIAKNGKLKTQRSKVKEPIINEGI